MGQKNFKDSGWDTKDSTYVQNIYLQNGKEFQGYSKKVGHAEKNDKEALLINWIVRMFNAGYLDRQHSDQKRRINRIEYSINKNLAKVPILRLRYQYYEVLNPTWAIESHSVINFLDDFYEALQRGDSEKIKGLYLYKKTRFNDPFDLNTKRFITAKSLLAYCNRMKEEQQFTEQQAVSFYHSYAEKFNI